VRYIWGFFDYSSPVVRDPTHQHYNSPEDYPPISQEEGGDRFPVYVRGSTHAISIDVLARVSGLVLHNDREQARPKHILIRRRDTQIVLLERPPSFDRKS